MRFAIEQNRLLPQAFSKQTSETSVISLIELPPQPPINPTYTPNEQLRNILSGKQLLLDELDLSLEEIQSHYEHGYLIYRKSIEIKDKQFFCIRCGNAQQHLFASFRCARCGENCTYCRHCMMMGRTSTCTPLISWTSHEMSPSYPNPLHWTGTLSTGQQHAANRVVEAVHRNESVLVWAVCGAGKTEVLFNGIAVSLQQGKRVCVATPRTDVVLELSPRLQKVFPDIPVSTLYGGSEDRHLYAPLTIATTHQLFRFHEAFDTMILDEMDAFPYSVDETLQYAAKHARKPNSTMIYLTATPNRSIQQQCHKGERKFVTIPARFHRYSLPVPQFIWCGNWRKLAEKGNIPTNALKWITNRIHANKQALLFVPNIKLMEKLLPALKKISAQIESVHAEDPLRKEKVQKMRQKEIPILVTTTILERGVTFPNIDVAVLGAEDQIFTESALVQISGRVGRSKDYPSGDIIFFHHGKTNSMIRARKQILDMNKEARKRGLIDD